MSITDSTTTLDTAWTEQSFVVFTSGVLASLANCVTEVESKLKRGTLGAATVPTTTQVENWLKRAKLELVEVKDYSFTRKYATASLSSGDYRVGLPEDYNGGAILRDTTNNNPILIVGRDVFDHKYPDLSDVTSNDPEIACIKNMELWLAPPVDSTTVLELDYFRTGAETTADSFAWLPELERFRCCDMAIAEAFDSLHMWAQADRFWKKWYDGLGKSIKADGRRKWRGKQISAINVFQDYNLRGFQEKK